MDKARGPSDEEIEKAIRAVKKVAGEKTTKPKYRTSTYAAARAEDRIMAELVPLIKNPEAAAKLPESVHDWTLEQRVRRLPNFKRPTYYLYLVDRKEEGMLPDYVYQDRQRIEAEARVI